MNEFEALRQAVESFIVAHATCSREDEQVAYKEMLKIARLEDYL